jgi:anti-anti-sigma regulatory factor
MGKPEGEERVLQVEGVLDLQAARELAARIAASGDAVLRVDLTRVREFHDFGVTVLAQALQRRRGKISVRGLRQHHLRLLRYLGIDPQVDLRPSDDSA